MRGKSVGAVGGMGPDVTVDLMRRVIEVTLVTDGIDHTHLLVDTLSSHRLGLPATPDCRSLPKPCLAESNMASESSQEKSLR
jgi:aspartate racemase